MLVIKDLSVGEEGLALLLVVALALALSATASTV
jgi:hypothetical protein